MDVSDGYGPAMQLLLQEEPKSTLFDSESSSSKIIEVQCWLSARGAISVYSLCSVAIYPTTTLTQIGQSLPQPPQVIQQQQQQREGEGERLLFFLLSLKPATFRDGGPGRIHHRARIGLQGRISNGWRIAFTTAIDCGNVEPRLKWI